MMRLKSNALIKNLLVAIVVLTSCGLNSQIKDSTVYEKAKMQWFKDAKLGIFICLV